jgi:uncharacterized protein YbcI
MGAGPTPADDADRDTRDTLLSRISTEMVRAQKQYFGKGPTQAKSYFLDDMLIIVMKGGLTTAEHTLIDFGQEDKVRDFRHAFETEMTQRFTELIEELTGREVLAYHSQVIFAPDRVVEMFVFDEKSRAELIEAAAAAELRVEPVAEVTAEDVGGDEPSSPAQESQ